MARPTRRSAPFFLFAAVVLILALGGLRPYLRLVGPAPASVKITVLQGSTTFNGRLIEPHRDAIEAMAGQWLTVIPNRSGAGLIALLEGRADLAMLSSAPETEIAALSALRPDLPFAQLRSFPVHSDRVAFAVHPSNPLRSISRAQLRDVLLGTLTNWQQLGGPDLPIQIVYVPGADGVTLSARAQLTDGRAFATKNSLAIDTHAQLIKFIAQEPAALGVAQLQLVHGRNLPELTVDTPVTQQLSLITLGEPSPALQAVIDAFRAIAARAS